jgi:hypothetical protein
VGPDADDFQRGQDVLVHGLRDCVQRLEALGLFISLLFIYDNYYLI